jgi:hypothetical protein
MGYWAYGPGAIDKDTVFVTYHVQVIARPGDVRSTMDELERRIDTVLGDGWGYHTWMTEETYDEVYK